MRAPALLLIIGMAGGCYTPQPPAGLPCSPGGHCPEGQTCGADQICHAGMVGGDPGGGGRDDAGGPGGESCADPGLPPELEGGTFDTPCDQSCDDGPTVQEQITVNDDDQLIPALIKSADPWDGPLSAGTYTFDLADSCAAGSKTCVSIAVVPPGGDAVDRTYAAVSGLLRVTIANQPDPPDDPANCAAHDGDVTGCDAQDGCGYFYCSETCRPDVPAATSLCDAQCARGCGIRMELDDVVFTDQARPGCSTHVSVMTLTSPPM